MKENIISKNYLFGTKICFLILSFIIMTIGITVDHDIWPFLLESLPIDQEPKFWTYSTTFIGIILPAIWLRLDWDYKPIRYTLLSLIIMYILQLLTEMAVAHYFFVSLVVPTQLLYISYRIVQLLQLQRQSYRVPHLTTRAKTRRCVWTLLSLIFWSIVLFKLTFVTIPKIIPDFF